MTCLNLVKIVQSTAYQPKVIAQLKSLTRDLGYKTELGSTIRSALRTLRQQNRDIETKYLITHAKTGLSAKGSDLGSITKRLRRDVKARREKMKLIPDMSTLGHKVIGMVHVSNGDYLKTHYERRAKQVYEAKKPRDNQNYLGIELEFISKLRREELATHLVDAGLAGYVTLKSDGSIKTDEKYTQAHEINILVNESEYRAVMARVAKVLSDCRVNQSCGMHVHLDMRNRSAEKSYGLLFAKQNEFYSMQPKSRQDNSFCKRQTQSDYYLAKSEGERYRGINLQSMSKFKTIEMRLHASTLDETKICNWIALLLNTVESQPNSSELDAYIAERQAKFGNVSAVTQEEESYDIAA